MSVSKKDTNPFHRVAQLEQEIASKELERRHIVDQLIIELGSQGESLRNIGKAVNLSHTTVGKVLAIHAAVKKAASE